MCQRSLRRTLDLYHTVIGSVSGNAKTGTGQTKLRRLLICMLAISEIPESDLDASLFAQFVARVTQNPPVYGDHMASSAPHAHEQRRHWATGN